VNPKPVGGDSSYYEEIWANSCKRCGLRKLVYVKELNGIVIENMMCPECGWQPLLKKKEEKEKDKVDSSEDDNEEQEEEVDNNNG
jgi:predicted  nucleic acid-binding Zn-ribbon protein